MITSFIILYSIYFVIPEESMHNVLTHFDNWSKNEYLLLTCTN